MIYLDFNLKNKNKIFVICIERKNKKKTIFIPMMI